MNAQTLPLIDRQRQILEEASRYMLEELKRGPSLESPQACEEYLKTTLTKRANECFLVVYLDTRHRVIEAREEFTGTIDGATVYPRVICRNALLLNAAAIIVAHNHPSGIPEPSEADKAITRLLKDALNLLDIRLLDHLVIDDAGKAVSFAARGLI